MVERTPKHIQIGLGLGLAGLVLTGPILANIAQAPDWSALGDVHLDVVPRTEDEAARIAAVLAPPLDFSEPQRFEVNSGGATTVRPANLGQAFMQPAANLSAMEGLEVHAGAAVFDRIWISAPSGNIASDGLGPLYNSRACVACHVMNGRGHPPAGPDDDAVSFALRLSVPADRARASAIPGTQAVAPEPVYGNQFHDFSVAGVPAEGRVTVEYETFDVALSGGELIELRRPFYGMTDLAYGEMHPETMISPRVAPQMIGLGLLEAIPAQDILAWADPDDLDGDGVSGRPNVVWSHEHGQPMLGRFGLKAIMPTLREQSADAFLNDIGISTPIFDVFSGDCTQYQSLCLAAPDGGQPQQDGFEVDDIALDLVTYFSQNLGVPARRDVDDPLVLQGKEVFFAAGCAACHRPSYVTARQEGDPSSSFQLIWPYTDLLLHDMGPDLADNRPEGRATGREWRTPPLWGIGLTEEVSGHSYFLHDGRARSLLEAILWHGGEGQASRDAVAEMPPEDRAALITFLESL
ncbi:MAG: di-heme oxidoredictase family protein [Pseudomonadota bacterium]